MKQIEPMRGSDATGKWTRLPALCIATVLYCFTASVNGLPDDQEQPIHITADQALRDENRGHTVYSGNVRMVQGSMELDADRLTIWHTSEDANKFVAKGAPARMRQQPEIDQNLIHAQANVITYWRNEQRVNLQTDARIEQHGDVVTGDTIVYFIERQLIKAESSQRKDDKRVSVVIQPTTQQGEQKTAPPEPAVNDDDETSQPDGAEPGATGTEQQDGEPSGTTESD